MAARLLDPPSNHAARQKKEETTISGRETEYH